MKGSVERKASSSAMVMLVMSSCLCGRSSGRSEKETVGVDDLGDLDGREFFWFCLHMVFSKRSSSGRVL